MRLPFATFCCAIAASLIGTDLGIAQAQETAKPNLLIFYSDDQGWGETGCYGNKQIPTPNIDALATNGVRFTQGYVAATYCSPSRAGLLTGRYPTRFGHEFNAVANKTGLRLDQITFEAGVPHGLHHHLQKQRFKLLGGFVRSAFAVFGRLALQTPQGVKVQIGARTRAA